jgi:hypothetical protein
MLSIILQNFFLNAESTINLSFSIENVSEATKFKNNKINEENWWPATTAATATTTKVAIQKAGESTTKQKKNYTALMNDRKMHSIYLPTTSAAATTMTTKNHNDNDSQNEMMIDEINMDITSPSVLSRVCIIAKMRNNCDWKYWFNFFFTDFDYYNTTRHNDSVKHK